MLVRDKLVLPDSGTADVVFGCETKETGEIYRQQADGLMGLGSSDISVINQVWQGMLGSGQLDTCLLDPGEQNCRTSALYHTECCCVPSDSLMKPCSCIKHKHLAARRDSELLPGQLPLSLFLLFSLSLSPAVRQSLQA